MLRQRLSLLARLVLSVLLIALLFSLIDRKHFLEHFRDINPGYLLLGLALYFLSVILWAVRWSLFIRAAGEAVSFGRVLQTTITGIFFSMFLPQMVGADLGRMYEMSRDSQNKIGVVSSVLLDRLMGLLTLVLMALVALVIGYEFAGDVSIVAPIVGSTGLLLAGWLIFFNRDLMRRFSWVFRLPILSQLEETFRSLYNALHHLQSQPRLLLSTLVVSLLYNSVEVLSVVMIAGALRVNIEPVYFFIFMPIVWVITMIPISIGGLGLREGVFAFLFGQVGITSDLAVAMSLLVYAYNVVVALVGGFFFFRVSLMEYLRKAAARRSEAALQQQ